MQALRIALWIACLLPLARLVWLGFNNGLGANPIEFISRSTGTWTLVLLLATLCVTPLRQLNSWTELVRVRRLLGLFAFFYASLHFLNWIAVDQFFDWPAMLKDIVKRPFVTVGFAGFVLLLPLALTSTDAARRRLKRNWARLHTLVYVVPVLGVLHYWWLVKKGVQTPLPYTVAVAVLLGWRVLAWLRARRPAAV
ncbi:MAG: sulfoxide reductase heme-binding subunit YedZ [Rhodocyclaceae bacterium]|nr:sulfoxide reductase heme-binding subunit YedZ [Rhodocyclaceae bacterium]